MNKLTKDEISEYRLHHYHAKGVIAKLGLSYPSITYEKDVEASWVEFDKCFNEKHAKYWANLLRVRHAEGKTYYSQHGRGN